MKYTHQPVLLFCLLSSWVAAEGIEAPMKDISVVTSQVSSEYQSQRDLLTMQNISEQDLLIDIYGQQIELAATSGFKYNCQGYHALELRIIGSEHEYFEVPCHAKVTFEAAFVHQNLEGNAIE